MKLELNQSDILYFDVKKIKKYRLKLCKSGFEVRVNKVIYLADIHPGYLIVWLDEQEQVWADYDNLVYYLWQWYIPILLNRP